MRVRAKILGYYDTVGDGRPREILPGQEFELSDKIAEKRLPRWVEKVEPKAPKAEAPPPAKPQGPAKSVI